jgi:hypothetical protein
MLSDAILKFLLDGGAGTVMQYFGGLIAIVLGIKLAAKGSADTKTAPTPPPVPVELEIPDWFARKVDVMHDDIKRVKWVLEDLRNKTGTGIE